MEITSGKKDLKLAKTKEKQDCEITGEYRITEGHRWGNKEEYEKYLKKKTYQEKLKIINQEKLSKFTSTFAKKRKTNHVNTPENLATINLDNGNVPDKSSANDKSI